VLSDEEKPDCLKMSSLTVIAYWWEGGKSLFKFQFSWIHPNTFYY